LGNWPIFKKGCLPGCQEHLAISFIIQFCECFAFLFPFYSFVQISVLNWKSRTHLIRLKSDLIRYTQTHLFQQENMIDIDLMALLVHSLRKHHRQNHRHCSE
jgi:hypothetical protein